MKLIIMSSHNVLRRRIGMALVIIAVIAVVLYHFPLHVRSDREADVQHLMVTNRLCFVNSVDDRTHMSDKADLQIIYYVTPTYPRPEQIPELIRLSHTLMHVPKIHWIVADDQVECSPQVLSVLRKSGLPFTHISSPKPYLFRSSNYPRGVSNRRAAIDWIRKNALEGILYFGDDDNTVDLDLFKEIRRTKKLSMFPVGLIGGYGVSAPIVKQGKVIGFFDSWPGSRIFPVDMAGFAVNIKYLSAAATMPYIAGQEEDKFLLSLNMRVEDIEPQADNCSKILVWHTKTVKYKKPTLKININKLVGDEYYNFANLLKETADLGMMKLDPKTGTKPLMIRNRKSYETVFELLNDQ
ncbi:hypothetical protein ACJJTC_018776 [Scirpophaga incertulas]